MLTSDATSNAWIAGLILDIAYGHDVAWGPSGEPSAQIGYGLGIVHQAGDGDALIRLPATPTESASSGASSGRPTKIDTGPSGSCRFRPASFDVLVGQRITPHSREPDSRLPEEHEMKFMVMHKHDRNTDAGIRPPPEFIAQMGALVGGLVKSGKLVDGDGLGPTKTRSRVTFRKGEHTVQHGPFAGSNELPAGFVKVTVKSRAEAVAAAAKLGEAIGGEVEVEAGLLTEAWDLGFGEKPADAPERYLLLYKATPASEAGHAPKVERVIEELRGQGVLTASAALAPSSRGKRLNWRGGAHTLVDGPFVESKEMIGGYVILELESMEECLAFVASYAKLMLTAYDALEIDIRPL